MGAGIQEITTHHEIHEKHENILVNFGAYPKAKIERIIV
jgi:hypothetical protein